MEAAKKSYFHGQRTSQLFVDKEYNIWGIVEAILGQGPTQSVVAKEHSIIDVTEGLFY